jgi:hypothetical protein
MNKRNYKLSMSIESLDGSSPEQAPNGDPIVETKPSDVTEIDGQKPVEKLGEDGIVTDPKALPKDENSFATAVGAPKGEDNTGAPGVPSVDKVAKEGAKGGVPEQPRQVTPSTESDETTTNGGVGAQGEGTPAEPSGEPGKSTEIKAPTGAPDDEIVINQAMSVEPDVEMELEMAIKEADYDFDQEQKAEAAAETLEVVQATVQEIVDSGTGSEQTLKLIDEAATPALEALGIVLIKPSMEQYGRLSIQQKHQIALESIGSALTTYAQWRLTAEEKIWHGLADSFRSTAGEIGKYEKALAKLKADIQTKTGNGKEKTGDAKFDLAGSWQFFSTGAGQVNALGAAAVQDVAADKAILVEHTAKVMELLKKFDSIVKAVPQNAEGFAALFKRVEALSSPAALFPKQLISNNFPLLNVKGLEVHYGSARKPVTVGGVEFTKMAQLATATEVKMVSSGKHRAAKVSGNLMGTELATSKKIVIKDGEAMQVADAGLAYLANAQEFLRRKDELNAIMKSIDAAMSKLGVVAKGLKDQQVIAGMDQVAQIGKNLVRGYQNPAASELARAIKGAKYCWFTARNMRSFRQ